MDRGDLEDLRIELKSEEASLDTPPNRTRRDLVDCLTALGRRLDALDDIDELDRACELVNHVVGEANNLRSAAVAFDRARSATWEEIGASLGMTKQAAWERFGP
jgi:hypothetical protein